MEEVVLEQTIKKAFDLFGENVSRYNYPFNIKLLIGQEVSLKIRPMGLWDA